MAQQRDSVRHDPSYITFSGNSALQYNVKGKGSLTT